jgi:hypothetical protein
MNLDIILSPLVDCYRAGIRSPRKLRAKLVMLGVEVDEITEEGIASLLQSPEFAKAYRKSVQDGDEYDSRRVRENRAKYLLKLEEVAQGEDSRTAFAANVKLLAYGGMVEVQKHEVDVHQAHEKLLKALAPEEGDGE